MDIISWIKTTLSKYSSNSTHDKNAIYFVKNEDGKTGKIISDEIVYGNGGGANKVVVESSNQPTGGESVWVNPDEDTEEVEVYSRQQTDALINTKQDELTLTVKDNGNIVIGNIQGQTKEFMPATPSGDPMHYAYEAAGAEYNDTGADIVKTAPWADMIDDDYTGDYGKTVVHKAGYWYLNGLGNLTNKSMQNAYKKSILCNVVNQSMRFYNGQTNINFYNFLVTNPLKGENSYASSTCKTILMNDNLYANRRLENGLGQFYNSTELRHIIGVFDDFTNALDNNFAKCNSLITLKFHALKHNVSFSDSPNLSIKSVLYMINGEAATSPITITLHNTVYNRCTANADIVAALEAHPNVSLASA